MKILSFGQFFPPRYVGGAEVAAFYSAYGLRQRGHDVRVLTVCTRYPEPFDNRIEYYGIPIHEVGIPPVGLQVVRAFDPRVYRHVLAELTAFRPDLVHVHNVSGASLAPFVACRRLDIPVVLTLHDHWLLCPGNTLYQAGGHLCDLTSPWHGCGRCLRKYDYWGVIPLRRKVFAWMTANVNCFISPSRRLVDLHTRCGYDPGRFRVLRNGLAPDIFLGTVARSGDRPQQGVARSGDRPQQGGTDSEVQVPDAHGANVALFSGALIEHKGVDILLEALPIVARYVRPFRLWVAGDGEPGYVARLDAVGFNVVQRLGKLPFGSLRHIYARADLTIVPSVWYDNSPVVICESLMAGTPVLGSDIGGIPELIQAQATGYLVPPRDPVALAEQVILHFAQPARRRREMRRACVEYAQQHLTLDHHLDGLLAIYRHLEPGNQ
jgi:glycosyltransferase involved in cell wall biosynthesis